MTTLPAPVNAPLGVGGVIYEQCRTTVAPGALVLYTDGRGLLLVRALADDWGVRPADEGRTTWFSLEL